MKKIAAILLLLCLLVHVSGKLLVWVNYEVNHEYIAKNLCENRNKPQMHCNGKCHLVKQLNNEERKEQSPVGSLKEQFEMLLFSEHFSVNLPSLPVETICLVPGYKLRPYSTILYSVFHPPQA